MKLSSKALACGQSPMRKFHPYAVAAAAAGKKIYHLNIGQPDIHTPDALYDAIHNFRTPVLAYAASPGIPELIEAIRKYYENIGVGLDESDILITTGGSEALQIAANCLLDDGDEVIVPEPFYPNYHTFITTAGGVIHPLHTKPEEGYFYADRARIEACITPKTKAILIGYPNNPTGTIMDRASLEKVAAFAKAHDLIVIADEIYCDLTYEGQHTCFASLPDMQERTIVLNGFSKSYAMTGLRIGYVCAPREALEEIYKVHQYEILCASTTSQYGAIEALRNCDDDVKAMFEEYAARREMIYQGLVDMGLTVFKPKGAFYIFPDISCTGMDEEEFCDRLLTEEKVGVVPGTCFGPQGKNHIRISYAASRENIAEALKRIARFVKKYKKA